jgi:hypothetical protein
MAGCASRRSENTAWNRVFADLGRIFSFPILPSARKYRLESSFD